MNNAIQLVTRGDDAGCCVAANQAVAQCLRAGVMKNASLMVPGPAFGDLVETLKGIPNVSLGLHVTLNSEWNQTRWGPVSAVNKVPALVDEHGHFLPAPIDLHHRQAPVDQMIAEVQAQLDRARSAGLLLDYIDEHMGVGWLAGLNDAITKLAETEGLVYLRDIPSRESAAEIADPIERLSASLAQAQQGTYLLVTHPMHNDASAVELLTGVPTAAQILSGREADRRFWLDERLPIVLAKHGISPIRYSQQSNSM